MTTKLEKMAEDYHLKLVSYPISLSAHPRDIYLKGAEDFRQMVLEYLVSPVSDCYLEQRESLSRQEVIDLLEGISDKIKVLGIEEG